MMNDQNSRLELLFMMYLKGRKMKSLAKTGNSDKALQTIILRSLLENNRDVTQISKIVSTNISAISELIEKMVNEGLVKKSVGIDKRYANLSITESGKSLLKNTEDAMKIHCISVFENLSEQEVISAINILNKIL